MPMSFYDTVSHPGLLDSEMGDIDKQISKMLVNLYFCHFLTFLLFSFIVFLNNCQKECYIESCKKWQLK